MDSDSGEGSSAEGQRGEVKKGMWKMTMGPKIAIFIVLGILFLVLWPFVFIWALNTIFLLGIPLNFWTWLATVVILLTLGVLFSFGRNS